MAEPQQQAQVSVVPSSLHAQRADRIVAQLIEVSRSVARELVDGGAVTVAGQPVAAADRLDEGTVVSVVPPPPPGELEAAAIDFDVVLEEPTFLVIDKPAGLVVHPGAGHRNDTLANGLINRYEELARMGVEHRWGLVHRLDRETSGLLLVARTPEVHRFLQSALKARTIGREYLAMVIGTFDNATGTIDAPISRDPAVPTRMQVVRGGRRAVTHYRRLASWNGITLLAVTLETGRTHQIRVHLAAIDHPVSGDRVYGRPGPAAADPGRVWLHATRLSFPHPDGSGDVTVHSPVPSDLSQTLEGLGSPQRGAVPTDV